MKAAPWIALLWAGSLAGTWFLAKGQGRLQDRSSGSLNFESKEKSEEVTGALPALTGAPAAPKAREGTPSGSVPAPTTPSSSVPSVVPGDAPATFSLEGIATPEDANRLFMAYAAARLAEGEKGHLELFKALDQVVHDKKLEALFGNDESAARYIYPWIKFLVGHEEQTVAMTETLYRTMAENPAFFEGADDDTLEVFTEGVAMVLPGAASEETLDRFRGYARKILDAPEQGQPESVRKNRRDIERALPGWAPILSSAEAAERLRKGDIPPVEALAYLRRLAPDDLRSIDVVAILGPLLDAGEHQVLRVLPALSLALDDRSLSTLDQRVLDSSDRKDPWWIRTYLENTGRGEWAKARPLVEAGLRRGGSAASAFARALPNLHERPPVDYVRSILDGLPEKDQAYLRANFNLK